MRFADFLWELMDNALYVMHLFAVLCLGTSAVACPVLLYVILSEVRELRKEIPPECQCGHECHVPGPVLPRVLPRVRRIGEEAD